MNEKLPLHNEPQTAQPRTVLITGGARRVGAAIAKTLAASGTQVLIHYNRSQKQAEDLAEEIHHTTSAKAIPIHSNLTEPDAPTRLMEKVRDYTGYLDGLVNNASLYQATPLEEIAHKDWQRYFQLHIEVPFFLTRALAPMLQQRRGAVVNITDAYLDRPIKGYLPYFVSKSGLHALTTALAKELAPDIRVNSIAPGLVQGGVDHGIESGLSDEQTAAILAKTPLERLTCPNDLAQAVQFLLFSARQITGQQVTIDGGRSLY